MVRITLGQPRFTVYRLNIHLAHQRPDSASAYVIAPLATHHTFVYFHNMDKDRESLLLTVLSPDYYPCPEQADDKHLTGQAEESDTV